MEPQDRNKDRQEAQEEERGGGRGRETRTMTTWPKRLMTSLGETNNVVLWVVHVAQHRDVRPPSPPHLPKAPPLSAVSRTGKQRS